LRARDLLRDFECDGLEVYNSPQTNLGAALAALNHLEDSPAVRRLQANVRVAATQVEERGPGYSRSAASSYYKSRSERPLHQRHSQGHLEPVSEEGRGENEVVQPVNPAANAAANAPANPAANAPANAPANVAGNVVNNAANAANVQGNVAPNPRHNAGAQPSPVQANRAEGSQCHHIRDEVEIADALTTTANKGSLTPSTLTTPSKLRTSGICTIRNYCGVPSTTRTMASKPGSGQQLPYIFTSSPNDQIPPGLQAGY
jgi:hypothetical protein